MLKFTCSIVVYSKNSLILSSDKYITLRNCLTHVMSYENLTHLTVFDNSPLPFFNNIVAFSDKISYVHLKGRNLGFGAAHNLYRNVESSAPYHLILNPDIVFKPGTRVINNLLDIISSSDDLCMVQPLVTYPDFKSVQYLCKKNPTLLAQFLRAFAPTPIKNLFKKYMYDYEMRNLAYGNSIIDSTYLSGAFMLCNRQHLDSVGWFDERYFMYLEDADLTRSLSRIGRCIHVPFFQVGHVWERGSHKNLSLMLHAINSFIQYSLKWGLKLS